MFLYISSSGCEQNVQHIVCKENLRNIELLGRHYGVHKEESQSVSPPLSATRNRLIYTLSGGGV